MYGKKNINRLLQYRNVLNRLHDLGFETVFSYHLGKEAGVSPEQVRKDFSEFGIKGNRKAGYDINELLFTINRIFKKHKLQKVILVGLGKIGMALIQYRDFRKKMIKIVAAFDVNPAKYKKKIGLSVYPMDQMKLVISSMEVKIAIIAVPDRSAQEVCNQLVECGIKGILNFSPTPLKVPSDVFIEHISICNSLEILFYQADESGT